jgi:phosphopantothenoylcysteine decarboxylase/phosphopantothenate--cysteine ligase
MLAGKRLLLIVSGGIAAYKTLELVRLLKGQELQVRAVLTPAGGRFVTALSLAALTAEKVYEDLFSLTDETEMGHIRLTRESDLVVIAPASADILAKVAHGLADDLATTTLLASDKPLLVAPAMNHCMWSHPATQANLARLRERGVQVVGPNEGDMACGEYGPGRMAEPAEILSAIAALLGGGRLAGRRALVTSGPTLEPIDPVRFIANRSSGRQGHAIATALAGLGAETTLVTGPTALADPPGVTTVAIETAEEMRAAALAALPADVAVCAAAVCDWRVAEMSAEKLKKGDGGPPKLALAANPDILANIAAAGSKRPKLVVGFAAETEKVIEHARAKLAAKGCDWILANDVSPETGTFGGAENRIHLLAREAGADSPPESWPRMSKEMVARQLAERIADHLEGAGGGAA